MPDTPRAEGACPDPEGSPGRRAQPWGPSHWWASAAPGHAGHLPPGSQRPHPWLTPQPPPWPFLTGPRGPTQPHPSPHPVSPQLQGTSDRQADAGRLGRAHGHRSRGPPLPTGRPTTDPRPGVRGKPSTSGRSPSGPSVTQRTRQESMDRGSISSSFIEKQQHWGPGRRRAMASAPAPVAHRDPLPGSLRPRNSVPLGALPRTKPTVDSASDRSPPGPPSPDLTSTSPQSVPERPCPGHPPHSASAPGKSSPRAPPLHAGLSSSLSPGGRRAGTQAGRARGERTRPRGQPAPAKHPQPPGALRHQALPLHTCTHTEAHVCAPTHRHTQAHPFSEAADYCC